tara:strand:+ start:171 stop:461 length:291 start_codon:yes stop_codon:yes gene_type:complete
MKNLIVFLTFFVFVSCENQKNNIENYTFEPIYIKASGPKTKTKFYNFDDLLIEGEYKKPQLLFIDEKQKVKFDRLLQLKKNLLPNLKNTSKDPMLR